MSTQTIKPGDFIRVVRQPKGQTITTITGLRGWITHVSPKNVFSVFFGENRWMAVLVERGLIHGEIRTRIAQLADGDFLTIKPSALARKMRAKWQVEQPPKDPTVEKLIEQLASPRQQIRMARAAVALKQMMDAGSNPYLPATAVTLRSKLNYPVYSDFELAGHGQARRTIACQRRKLNLKEKAQLCWYNEAADRTCFWSGDQRVRALVQELDIDPFIRRFDGAVYRDEQRIFVSAPELRVAVIRELNRGRQILSIEGGKVQDGCHALSSHNEEPTHFFVTTARRRKLPAVAAEPFQNRVMA
jgi:hypothetical protein